jgi:electron transfer flavoprotein beta subunit
VTRPLEILVCMKQVLDTEVSSEVLRVDSERLRVSGPGVPPVLDPYAANALKGALDLKGEVGATIAVLSVGAELSKAVLTRTLAAGADRVLALRTEAAPEAFGDGLRTARQLEVLVRRVEAFDLILTGRMAADTNSGATGPALAALLGLPLVTMATRLQRGNGAELIVERLESGTTERIACSLPALVTVSSEIGELPPIGLPRLREARSKPFEILDSVEAGLTWPVPGIELLTLEKPSRERDCRILSGDDARQSGVRLAEVLREEGLL